MTELRLRLEADVGLRDGSFRGGYVLGVQNSYILQSFSAASCRCHGYPACDRL